MEREFTPEQAAAMRAFADPVVREQLVAITRKLMDENFMAAVTRQISEAAAALANRELWVEQQRNILAAYSVVTRDFAQTVQRSVAVIASPEFMSAIRTNITTMAKSLSDPALGEALRQRTLLALSQRAAFSDAVRQTIGALADQMADPAFEAAVKAYLAEQWEAETGGAAKDGPFPVVLFANFVYSIVVLLYVAGYLSEANRTNQDLTQTNAFDLGSHAVAAFGIAWSVRLAILRAMPPTD